MTWLDDAADPDLFPLEPLFTLIGQRLGLQPHRHLGCPCHDGGRFRRRDRPQCLSAGAIAAALNVERRTVARWIAAGGISFVVADRAAIAAGTHPVLIWPEWGRIPEGAS